MKYTCKKCDEEKEETEFHKRKDRPKGRASICRLCSNKRWQEYKRKNPEKIAKIFANWKSIPANHLRLKELWSQRDKNREKRLREILNDFKKDKSCKDCKQVFPPYVLDFDHRPGEIKLFNVGQVSKAWSVKRLFEEINKCDLVCSNCHRERTFSRKAKIQ
jgi:hypothetical protein